MIYLYIKTHNKTGLKYFGKTIREDVSTYKGSGRYWIRHLKVHGYDVSTEVVASFEEESQELKDFCKNFSEENNIVESEAWANLTPEDGVNGWPAGRPRGKLRVPRSQQYRLKMSMAKAGDQHPMWGKHHSEESKKKISEATKGKVLGPKTEEHKEKLSKAIKGRVWWTNGKTSTLANECPGEGFRKGRMYRGKPHYSD